MKIVVAICRNCVLMVVCHIGHHAECVRPVKLALSSDEAQTFHISDEKVGTISIAEGQLSVLRDGPGPRNPCCRQGWPV